MSRTNPFPSDNVVEKLHKTMRTARQEFAGYEHVPTPAERRRMARPRAGGDKIVSLMLEVATQFGLDLPNAPVASMREAQAVAERLRPLLATLRTLQQSVADTEFSARSLAWSSAMTYYTVLGRLAEHDEHLRAAIEPAVEFFTRRTQAVREEQAVARAERKVEKAQKKAAQAKKAADLVKARRTIPEAQPVPAAAHDTNGVA